MNKPDLEALVSPKIAEAIQAAVDRVGRGEFETIAGIDDTSLLSILSETDQYVPVALVTLACEINKSHGDLNSAHSSVTECLKGTTIRMPTSPKQAQTQKESLNHRGKVPNLYRQSRVTRTQEGKSFRLLGFSVNTVTFLILGYFLGGALVSPLLREPSCTGISASPPALVPCTGSIIGIILGAIGGLGYTYYYFVKKV